MVGRITKNGNYILGETIALAMAAFSYTDFLLERTTRDRSLTVEFTFANRERGLRLIMGRLIQGK